ncbi:dipeptidase [Amycolatopsis acidiphila]|uniref:Diguanylate cyclase n=1 Tax=Amycolatopsis acidiphila TaxID=715473 RepID=A0A558AJ07_9PSEU|nr:membrane dipeptidase [Amycolatopsis acidiphila]TVT24247.1 diguanylate cyclase [Amycolatopsis acidiphila]UIJ62622.1 dipeptidase [Amycolatopsis acidiphila]GHG85815.1 peptidase [Amycolatopsis acidiphila]
MSKATQYTGYRSYSYLTPGVDYDTFELSDELARVPEYDLGLDAEQLARTRRLVEDNIVVSLHDHPQVFPRDVGKIREYIRTGREHTGYAGLARSGMTAVFDNLMDGTACVTSKCGWKWDDVLYDIGMRLCDLAHQDFVRVVYGLDDIQAAHENGQVGLVLCLEASTPIENEVDRIDILYGFGVRQMGIAYSESNTLGSGLKEKRDGGLTVFGRRAVERMNKLGMAIDVSHSGDQTCLDVFEVSEKPVLITHAGARAIWPTPRMMPDDVLKACAQAGGVLGLEAAPHTSLSKEHPRHSLESVMDHFTYCVELMGIEHVAFGPDTLYGDHVGLHKLFASNLGVHDAHAGPDYEEVPYVAGLENPTECFFNIVGWLVKHGYSDEEIQLVIGGNVLRALEQIW